MSNYADFIPTDMSRECSPMINERANIPRRGRGRPLRVMTVSRGRPRLQNQPVSEEARYAETPEYAYLCQSPINQVISGPDINEWYDAIVQVNIEERQVLISRSACEWRGYWEQNST